MEKSYLRSRIACMYRQKSATRSDAHCFEWLSVLLLDRACRLVQQSKASKMVGCSSNVICAPPRLQVLQASSELAGDSPGYKYSSSHVCSTWRLPHNCRGFDRTTALLSGAPLPMFSIPRCFINITCAQHTLLVHNIHRIWKCLLSHLGSCKTLWICKIPIMALGQFVYSEFMRGARSHRFILHTHYSKCLIGKQVG